MTTNTEQTPTCLYCGQQLSGRQTKYCSDAHRQAFKRKMGGDIKRASAEANAPAQRGQPASQTQSNKHVVDISAYRKLRASYQTLQATAGSLRQERDRLLTDNKALNHSLQSMGHDKGIVIGRLSAADTQIKQLNEQLAQSKENGRTLLRELNTTRHRNTQLSRELQATNKQLTRLKRGWLGIGRDDWRHLVMILGITLVVTVIAGLIVARLIRWI